MQTDINIGKHWFVLKAVFGTEMKVKELLDNWKAPIENFIPMKYNLKTLKGKKQKVMVPAINDLIFVHSEKKTIEDFKQQVLTMYNKKTYFLTERKEVSIENERFFKNVLAVVPDKQMQDFMEMSNKFFDTVTYYRSEEVNIVKGMRVRVIGGLYDGVEGCVLKTPKKRSKRIVLQIPGVAITTAEIKPDLIQIIESNESD